MSIDNPYAMHFQSVWEERAADRRLPTWARVSFLAYGRHKANGHATFSRGMLGILLGSHSEDGQLVSMDRSNVQRAIRAAVGAGWLADGSGTECLIVPAHAIHGGLGSASAECPIHQRKVQQRRERDRRRNVVNLHAVG